MSLIPEEKRDWRPAIIAALAALSLYAVTLGGTYVYDDRNILFGDERISDVSRWGEFWTRGYVPRAADNLYRPLTSMSYAIQWKLHGDVPWAFHLVNVLLHAAASAAVAELARRFSGFKAGLAAGLLFAVHPVHVEPVAYVVGRAELLCTLFSCLALILFVERPLSRKRVAGIVGCFILAVLTKEQGMLVPLLILIWAVLRSPRRAIDQQEMAAIRLLIISLCWSLAIYIAWREHILKFWWDRNFLDWTIQPMIRSHGIDRWLMPIALLGRYKSLFMFPMRLSPDYGGAVIGSHVDLHDKYLYIGASTILIWTTLLIISIRRKKAPATFCLLGVAVSYGMVANLVTLIGTNFGERLVYMPSMFFIMFVAMVLAKLPSTVGRILLIVLVTLGSIRSFTYAQRWNDRLSFYQTSMKEQPRAIALYLLVAEEFDQMGKLDAAEKTLAQAREVMPDYDSVWIQSAIIALKQDRLDDADKYLDVAYGLRRSLYIEQIQYEVAKRRQELKAKSEQNSDRP